MTRTVSAAPIRAITLLTAARALRAARGRQRPESPAELARRLIPGYVVTPAIKLLSDELVRAVEEPDSRLIVTMPPRTGKSVLVSQVFPVWLLSRDPDAEIIVKSYGAGRGALCRCPAADRREPRRRDRAGTGQAGCGVQPRCHEGSRAVGFRIELSSRRSR